MKVLEKLIEKNRDLDYKAEGTHLKIVGESGYALVKQVKRGYKGNVFHVEVFDSNSKYVDGTTEYHLYHAIETAIWMLRGTQEAEVV